MYTYICNVYVCMICMYVCMHVYFRKSKKAKKYCCQSLVLCILAKADLRHRKAVEVSTPDRSGPRKFG